MRLVIQRVKKAKVTFCDKENKINEGLVVLLGIHKDDTVDDIKYLVNKLVTLRIFEENDKLNLSVKDINGEILLISQFTLYSNTSNGTRPSFEEAMKFNEAKKLYDSFINYLDQTNIKFKTGEFGEDMDVSLINNGPVTIIIDSKEK